MISEVRSRGAAGGADEFVELWNPTGAPIALDATWVLEGRSATAAAYNARWKGAAGRRSRPMATSSLGGSAYAQSPAPDDDLLTGITDATSLRLKENATIVDAICYAFSAATTTAFDASYSCEAPPRATSRTTMEAAPAATPTPAWSGSWGARAGAASTPGTTPLISRRARRQDRRARRVRPRRRRASIVGPGVPAKSGVPSLMRRRTPRPSRRGLP